MSRSAQRQALQELCDREVPQAFPGNTEFNVIHPLKDDLISLHPVGDTTLYTRHGTARILLVCAHPPAQPFTPTEELFSHVALFYKTSPNFLQQLHHQLEEAKCPAHFNQTRETESDGDENTYDLQELEQWRESQPSATEDLTKISEDLSPWEILEHERQRRVIWLNGVPIELDETYEANDDDRNDPLELQRRKLIVSPTSSFHLEPLLLRQVTSERVFAILSDRTYSYLEMY